MKLLCSRATALLLLVSMARRSHGGLVSHKTSQALSLAAVMTVATAMNCERWQMALFESSTYIREYQKKVVVDGSRLMALLSRSIIWSMSRWTTDALLTHIELV